MMRDSLLFLQRFKLPLRMMLSMLAASALVGCARVPAIDVEGSFVPSWMLCLLIGALVAIVSHALVSRAKAHAKVAPAVVFYPGIVIIVACVVWLFFFR